VDVGTILTFCNGNAFIGGCPGIPAEFCEFLVSQRICVQVPLTFHAKATATPAGIICGTPAVGSCPEPTACTYTIGYFKNNPELVNTLITNAGGSVVLGIGAAGLSFTVTTANANAVLSLTTPSPPAPASPPYDAQYQILYAQLLAAKLNVLNGAACEFAAAAIAAADTFLADSPAGGMAGAGTIQDPLETFNEGDADGCPGHCTG